MDKNSQLEQIKQQADIVEVISEYVPLKKRGKNYLALCPFHSEKTPSFTVSQEKQLYHCFGCGEGGNVFTFLMRIENVSFWEAAKILADKYNIPLEIEQNFLDKEKYSKVKLLNSINYEAAVFFNSQIQLSTEALNFANSRGLDSKTISFFKIGFAPNDWDKLYKHLLTKGFSPKDIELAGLIVPRDDQKTFFYDRFRNRIMFPIFDIKGNVCAFGGRSIDGSEPKYINSPETPIYNKSEVLYGLNFTKDEIKKLGSVLIVEGYMDFISCFSAGIKNVIATSGTSLTPNQIRILQRYAKDFYLTFDSDSAGSAATERTITLLKSFEIYPKIVLLKDGKDPDEVIRKFGVDKIRQAIINAVSWVQYQLDCVFQKYNFKEVEGRSKIFKESIAILLKENDKLLIEEYSKYIANKLSINKDIVDQELKRQTFYNKHFEKNVKIRKPVPAYKLAEKKLIKLLIEDKDARKQILQELNEEDFSEESLKKVFLIIKNNELEKAENIKSSDIIEILDIETQKIFTRLIIEDFDFDDKEKDIKEQAIKDYIKTLKTTKIKRQLHEIRMQMHEAEKSADFSKITALQQEYKNCHNKMRCLTNEF